jgi:hypothetical protein
MTLPAPQPNQRTYHGDITPDDMAAALLAEFSQGNLQARQIGDGRQVLVQIATRAGRHNGGHTGIAVALQPVEDGVNVTVGPQDMLGIAASLGQTALTTVFNPLNLIGRLGDLAQDVNALNLTDKIWATLEQFARATRSTKSISARLQSVTCPYCSAANRMGAAQCSGCGGPLGDVQPVACLKCGNVMPPKSHFCGNCGAPLGR